MALNNKCGDKRKAERINMGSFEIIALPE